MQLHLVALLTLLLYSCQSGSTHFTGEKNCVPYHIRIDQPVSLWQRRHIQAIIDKAFAHINATYNRWNPQSEISRANSRNIHDLSPELEHLILLADRIVTLSDGRFDPTLAPQISQLKKSQKIGEAEYGWNHLIKECHCYGWNLLKLKNHQLVKGADVEIDLDSIAKGQGIDEITEALHAAGYKDLYVEWGGEIAVSGKSKRIAILNPTGGPPLEIITLNHGGIATSGDTSQQWCDGEFTLSHFVDARTGKPRKITSIAAVTVVASTCALADGLSTAAMLFDSEEELKEWAAEVEREIPGTAFWIVTRST